jgi:protein involved in temperature-dependent protein secretion
MDNMHPADELAWLRGEIRRLARREAALRERFVAGSAPVEGVESRVKVQSFRRAVFRRERLPDTVLCDPALWETQLTHRVTVVPRDGDGLSPAPRREDELRLIEPA